MELIERYMGYTKGELLETPKEELVEMVMSLAVAASQSDKRASETANQSMKDFFELMGVKCSCQKKTTDLQKNS